MDEKLQHNGLNELEGTGNYKYEDSDIGPHHQAVEAVKEESRQSRGCNGSSGVRFASLLRSSLRLSTSTKKTPKSTSSSTISTASLSFYNLPQCVRFAPVSLFVRMSSKRQRT
ncbi:hypothetical protein TcWFU_001926 [Taenia crassiceps]|uniref:Uncharacterized protein n=1 Tax=Taenia crassiceps TaxID=6207 RepID=A0ABR4QAN5_9CEST